MEWPQRNTTKRLVLLLILIIIVASIIITAVVLVSRGPAAGPRRLKPGTLAYEPITDVEVARQLVAHPGAELFGVRYRLEPAITGVYAYVEVWENGVFRGMVGASGGPVEEREGSVRCSFGVNETLPGVDWCLGLPLGGTYKFSQAFPEAFMASAWSYTMLTEMDAAMPITADTPIILAVAAITDDRRMESYSIAQLQANPDLLREYRYVQLLKCEFYIEHEWPEDEVSLGVAAHGELLQLRDTSRLPERDAVDAAVGEYIARSAAWPARDITTVSQAVYIRLRQPGGTNAEAYQEFYAFRLEDGTAVLQSQEDAQFSTISQEVYVALLEAALRYTP